MPKRRRLSTKRSASAWASGGASSIENSALPPLKSRFHRAWPGSPASIGVRTRLHLRLTLEPSDDLGGVRLVHGEAGGGAAQALERAEGIVGTHCLAKHPGVAPDLSAQRLPRRDGAHDEVGVACQIFGDGDDRDVGAEREWTIEARAAPGVVHGEQRLAASAAAWRAPARPGCRRRWSRGCRDRPSASRARRRFSTSSWPPG